MGKNERSNSILKTPYQAIMIAYSFLAVFPTFHIIFNFSTRSHLWLKIIAGVIFCLMIVFTVIFFLRRGMGNSIRKTAADSSTDISIELSVPLKHSGIIAIYHGNQQAQSVLEKKLAKIIIEPSENKKKIRILAYYGDVFLRNHRTNITEAIYAGVDIQMLIAPDKSDFVKEVWDLEVANPKNKKTNDALDRSEQDRAGYIIDDIEKYAEGKKGSFNCHIYSTQIRYALITINEEWAWWTPYHPGIEVKDTTSFELTNSGDVSIIKQCIEHFDLLWGKSPKRNSEETLKEKSNV